ncbi:MACPF domain-containing protein [Sesbania bispinosa]|nr:MACPF domain-containing protein [Sesbania bispinosa]
MGIFGPMLHIDTTPVDVGNRPVTGLRLKLEGTRSNRLAIHLQHLDSLPKSFLLSDNIENGYLCCDSHSCNFHKKVKWNCFSYVCTAPIESDDSLSIVTGAQLLVERNCLRLRLRFSKVIGATLQKLPEWDRSCNLHCQCQVNSGCIFIVRKRNENEPKPGEVTVGSSSYSFARPSPVNTPKLERFVDTSEVVRGPIHSPGYWVVSGAGLYIQNGRMNLRVKYSLFNFLNDRPQTQSACFD